MAVYGIGNRLRQLRSDARLTQKQVADRIGLTESAVSTYESEVAQPPAEMIVKLAALYHVTTDYILGVERKRSIVLDGLAEEDEKHICEIVELAIRIAKKNR